MPEGVVPFHRMQVRENAVVIYMEPNRDVSPEKRLNMVEVQKHQYSGKVTEGVRKRMQRAITLMSQATKPKWITNEVSGRQQLHRFSFVTLTVANNTRMLTPREGYPLLLKPFLRWLRETIGVKLYLWRAEPQKRGQLHYHLVIPDFIHYQKIRNKWNEIQRDAGLLTEWFAKHGNYKPNGTEIRETRSVRNMTSYIQKEFLKRSNGIARKAVQVADSLIKAGELPAEMREAFIGEYKADETAMDGKIWGCSDNLSGVAYYTIPCRYWHLSMLNKLVRNEQARKVSDDYWMVIYFEDGDPPDLLNTDEKFYFNMHIQSILN